MKKNSYGEILSREQVAYKASQLMPDYDPSQLPLFSETIDYNRVCKHIPKEVLDKRSKRVIHFINTREIISL